MMWFDIRKNGRYSLNLRKSLTNLQKILNKIKFI